MNQDWNEKTVFLEALQLSEDERNAYLTGACPSVAARARIETLLRHHAQAPPAFLTSVTELVEEPSDQPQQIDEFRILRVLGEGGMGMVYLAQDTILGRKVALKVLAHHLSGREKALERFRKEAQSTAALNHAAIVPVYRFGRDREHCYLVSEYVDGPTLTALIEQHRELRRTIRISQVREWHRRTAEIVASIAEALDCAHRHGIVHRDVKPANILIDNQRGPRLTDFGIAKHLTDLEVTQHTGVVGSCHYMSPEQASMSNAGVDRRSDVFSLGVVLYEMLALRVPFDGNNVHQVIKAVLEQEPQRLRSIDKCIPVDFETICHKAIEKAPVDRYQTAAHMAADLRCALAGDPILARPPGPGRRIARFIRRRRGPVVAAMLVFLASAAGVLGRMYVNAERHVHAVVNVSADQPGSAVWAATFDQNSLMLGPARQIGLTPLGPALLEPGHYRLTVVAPNGSFAEIQRHFRIGHEYTISADITATTGVTDRMIELGDAEMEVDWSLTSPGNPPRYMTYVEPFYIDRREVSNAEYKQFVSATGHNPPIHWDGLRYDESLANRPVVGINQQDAEAYAAWAGKRLPTVLEWQFAARHPDNRRYPWGDELDDFPPEFDPTCQALRDAQSTEKEQKYAEYVRATVDTDLGQPNQNGLLNIYQNVSEWTANIDLRRDEAPILLGARWSEVPARYELTILRTKPSGPVTYHTGFRCARSKQPIFDDTQQD